MNRINFNIKDRKFLYGILCIVLVSVFTLTIAYAALSAVLTISGSAQVSSADWDIHFDNIKVKSGSVSGEAPKITTPTTATFSTTLNMPGEYYEFTIDVVNDGSIDAMIGLSMNSGGLDAEQAKYIRTSITYENGTTIGGSQLLKKDSFARIKIRVEYRSDILASDLPTSTSTITFGLTLMYMQDEGNSVEVPNNGVYHNPVFANGSIEDIGIIVTIGDEQFYTIGTEENNVKLLSMYNLYVGGYYSAGSMSLSSQNNDVKVSKLNYILEDSKVQQLAGEMPTYSDFKNSTGMQDSRMKGYVSSGTPYLGVTVFSNTGSTYAGSIVEGYVNNYKSLLETNYNIDITEARLIRKEEVASSPFLCEDFGRCSNTYSWIYSTSYWTESNYESKYVCYVRSDNYFADETFSVNYQFGVRPVIVISKDYFN